MIKVIYAVNSVATQYSGNFQAVAGCIIADTPQEAELIAEHLRKTIRHVNILIVGEPSRWQGQAPQVVEAKLPHDFKTHEHSWIGALERLIELEPDRDERLYWEHELKAMRNAYSVLRGEKEDD